MRKAAAILSIFLIPLSIFAQDKLPADRPSENIDPQTVGKRQFLAEIGFDRLQENSRDHSWHHPDALFRFGLGSRIELRMEVIAETQKSFSENDFRYGLQPIQLGLKAGLFETADHAFSASFAGQAGIPGLSSEDHDPHKFFHRLRLLFENELTDKVSLGYNFGTDWDSDEAHQNWVYTLTPQLEVSSHWHLFVEAFGHFRHGHPDHNLNGGVAYLIGNNAQADLSGSIGLTPHSPHYLLSAGFSVLLK